MTTQNLIINFIFKFMSISVVFSLAQSENPTEKLEHEPLEFVEFDTRNASTYIVKIRLDRVSKPFLANTNVPVWLISRDNSTDNVAAVRVMDEVGKFDFYRNTDDRASAVFFRKTGTLVGTFGTENVLDHIRVNSLYDYPSLLERNKLAREESSSARQKNEQDIHRPHDSSPEVVYIEVFVIVNYDIMSKFENKADMVSDILVGFNSADMLFSKVENPKIKLNIAGIAIVSDKVSLPEFEKNQCYDSLHFRESEELNATCAFISVQQFLKRLRGHFPFNSYDVVVFLTGYTLNFYTISDDDTEEQIEISGLSYKPAYEGYEGYRLTHRDLRGSVVKFTDDFKWFPILAHELAHLFNAQHDEDDSTDDFDECIGCIMRDDGDFCGKCLRFSDSSLNEMRSFFNSREGCIFRNEPVSLNFPQKPTLKLSRDEQCRCYGFSRASRGSILKRLQYGIRINYPVDICTRRIKCLIEYGHSEKNAGLYMDNSKCGCNKVCFQEKCRSLRSL